MNLAPAGARLIGEWQTRPDLVALVDSFANVFVPIECANLVRSLSRRLGVHAQYLLATELRASPPVAEVTAARVAWRTVPPAAINGFAAAMSEPVLLFLLAAVARRLTPELQLALAAEIAAPLGPALTALRSNWQ